MKDGDVMAKGKEVGGCWAAQEDVAFFRLLLLAGHAHIISMYGVLARRRVVNDSSKTLSTADFVRPND